MALLDYLIIGAGPAGLQMGYFLKKAKENYLILEANNTAGSFFQTFPRHRKLISINKPHCGYKDEDIKLRWDWNSLISDNPSLLMTKYSDKYFPDASVLHQYLNDYQKKLKINVQYKTRVKKITKNKYFTVEDQRGKQYHAKRVIIATGLSKPYLPPIPGIHLTENYVDVSVNPRDFLKQRVLIIGKGNSGFETADNLIETTNLIHVLSPQPLTHSWKSHHVGHLRAVNNNFLDTYQLKNQNAVLDAMIDKIEKKRGKFYVHVTYSHAEREKEVLIYDRVICCAGFCFDFDIFDKKCMPEKVINDRFPKLTSDWEATNIPDLYFIGIIMQMRDFKKLNSGFIHGFRHNEQSLMKILHMKYDHEKLHDKKIRNKPKELTEAIIKRINRSPALWLMNGFLCDAITVDGQHAYYHEDLPLDYVADETVPSNKKVLTISLEFGKIEGDPFNIQRHPDPKKAKKSTFLHPVIRYYRNKKLIRETHLLEDLYGEWKKDIHVKPLLQFVKQALGLSHK